MNQLFTQREGHGPTNGTTTSIAEGVSQAVHNNPTLYEQLLSNPLFTGGFGLACIGAVVRYGSVGVRSAASLLRERILVNMEVQRNDASFPWFLEWITQHHATRQQNGAGGWMERLAPRLHHLQAHTRMDAMGDPSGKKKVVFSLLPGLGRSFLYFRGAWIAVTRERVGRAFDSNGVPFESIRFTTLYRHRFVLDDMFREAHLRASRVVEGKMVVYTSTSAMGWAVDGPPMPRKPFDSVVLARNKAEFILNDVKGFLSERQLYLNRGIRYTRGYLLHGPPGTGKTSYVEALAGALEYNIAMLSLSQRGLTDDRLKLLLRNLPADTIVLLEDADAAFNNRRQADGDGYAGANVTFSGLLNALDGVGVGEGRIVFMTTNFIDRLDPGLVRPGRVDKVIELGNVDTDQAARLWERYYGEKDVDGKMKDEFVQRLADLDLLGSVSPAQIQGLYLDNKYNPRGAIEMVETLKKSR
ncbi:P-loop containing nucleoside triphosphate hydrolase protein [Piedraia hortae CBS 480.64]|uniref:P-loop containing nucleoside triphosphate hydrolase protein n=1 Tax=Piedraia hortae CBS 480.64 TaxID=1314780 RepID=A0A6A7BYJ4_9PEZI|nr:P-loop containing nucleoside triphosphate hydrolase protein [Piedraia hortae CBS 480.64]